VDSEDGNVMEHCIQSDSTRIETVFNKKKNDSVTDEMKNNTDDMEKGKDAEQRILQDSDNS